MTGRCAGCGLVNRNSAVVREHVRYCPEFLNLFLTAPERALEPEDEFARYRDEDRQADRQKHKDDAISEADRRRAEQAARWETPPDLLS